MRQTLFVIPQELAGIPVFGFGWLLALWAVVSLSLVGWYWRKTGWSDQTKGYLPVIGVTGLAIAFLLPALIEPAGLPIRGYGVMLALSVLLAIWLCVWRAERIGLQPEMILSLATWLCVTGFLGARLFYVIEYWHDFQKPTLGETLGAMINVTQGGLVVYGSLLAGGAALIVFVYKHHLPGLALADLVAPGVVLGVGLGRIGCFLNGCCYGGITDVPWAVQFPAGSPAYADQVQRGDLFVDGILFTGSGFDPAVIDQVEPGSDAESAGLKPGDRITAVNGVRTGAVKEAQWELLKTTGAGTPVSIDVAGQDQPRAWTISGEPPRSRPVHPTQIYSLIDALLLCFFILAYEPYKRWDGELSAIVLTIHPITRFLLEIIRVDESAVFQTGMSISQNISIGIFIGGVVLWIYLLWRRPHDLKWPAQVALS